MSVEVLPEELGFRRPFAQEVTQTLTIANTDKTPVAFKVKTTAPKQYCVRPNSGIVRPGNNVEVQVLLQAMKEEPPLEAKCRDKFLVQTVRVDEVDEANMAAIWANVEKTDKTMIQDKKIKVTFLPAAGTIGSPGLSNGVAQDEPPSYASATPQYGSPAPATIANTDVRTPQSRSMYSAVTNEHPTTSPTTRSTGADTHGSPQSTGLLSGVTNLVPTSQQELQDQLAAAQSKIKELTNQISDPQVRQRKVAEAQEKVATVVQQTQETGVPLHITAGLCLLSFLIAWLFF